MIIIIYLSFLWAVFSGLFFLKSNSTIWRAPNPIIGGLHYFFDFLIIIVFLLKASKNNISIKNIKGKALLLLFIISIILSGIFNYTNTFDALRFFLTIISPVIIYLILVYDKSITNKQIKNAFFSYILVCIVQFLIAVYNNHTQLLSGVIIIDDFFRGTMGAYQFVFLLNIYSIYVINKLIILRKSSVFEIFLMSIFILSFIISGAGGYLLIFLLAILLNLLFIYATEKQKMKIIFISLPIIAFVFFIVSYFVSNYLLVEDILNKFIVSGLSNNPKVLITLQALQPIFNPFSFIFGLGPGQYLSGIGGNVNAKYFGGIILDQMGSSTYGANSDLLTILTEIGITGATCFYALLYSLIFSDVFKAPPNYSKVTIPSKVKLYQMSIIGVSIYSLLLSMQYRIFMFFVASNILWFFLGILKRKLLYEKSKI